MFVLVPNNSAATIESIKNTSSGNNKVYFMEKYQQIVAKGVSYGVDLSTANELKTLVDVVGGTVGDNGTVEVDFSNLNYYTSEGTKTIIGAIKAIDAALKVEMNKLAASKTLDTNYEFTGKLKYVPAVKNSSAAYIVMTNKDDNELANTKIDISKIIGNGVLDHSEYVKETGILHLWFKQADGSTRDEQINLAEMLDIDDVLVKSGSENYLEVADTTKVLGYRLIAEPHTEITVEAYNALSEGEKANYEAINEHGFEIGTKIVTMDNVAAAHDDVPAVTGIADALDVKTYVDSKTTDLSVRAQGDAYVSASIDPTDNKKVIIATNKQNVSASAGTRGTWSVTEGGEATLSGEDAPSISGVASSLMDGEQAINAIKTYVDAKVAAEAAERAAKISATIKALDVTDLDATGGSNVGLVLNEVDGKVTSLVLSESYATVTRTSSTSTSDAPTTDGAISVADGDTAKLIKASDLFSVAAYAADKAKEAQNKVEKQIADLGGDVTSDDVAVATVQVTTEAGEVSDVVVTTISAGVNRTGDAKNARVLAATLATGAVTGGDIATIKGYVDDVVADNTANLAVTAEGDTFVSASVNAGKDNKHVIVKANTSELTIGKVGEADTTISGVATTLVNGGEIATKVSTFVNTRIAEEIDKLDVTEATVSENGEGAINFKYSENNGKVAINSLSVTYAEHTPGAEGAKSDVTAGIVTGTVLNDVLADMWETYKDA